MDRLTIFLLLAAITINSSTSPTTAAATAPAPFLPPAPAPSPTPVNLTHLLTVAGPFHTFLSYLQSTNVITTFQNQVNTSTTDISSDTPGGITIFVPRDSAFSNLKSPSLKNLTSDQLRSLCLFHALPQYYSISDFNSLSLNNPVTTFAGGEYTLTFTDSAGTVRISSEWTKTKITSSVMSTAPVAVYEIDRVLLPIAIFGTDIPPSAAPAPAPQGPVADSPDNDRDRDRDRDRVLSPPVDSNSSATTALFDGGRSYVLFAAAVVAVVAGLFL